MYTFESRIRYSETDSEGKLTMASLVNYFQDCSTFQSEDLGVGLKYLKERNMVWVLSAWQIVVDRYPEIGEHVTIGTLPYDLKSFLGYRNFFMKDAKGNFLAKANSLWTLLDTRTGRPVAITEEMAEKYVLSPKLDMDYASRKIALPKESEQRETIVVNKHHLDTNHHVNNQQYIDMAMGCLPENFCIGQLRAEYKKQAFLGDKLIPKVSKSDTVSTVVLTGEDESLYMAAEFAGREAYS